jgi:integrase
VQRRLNRPLRPIADHKEEWRSAKHAEQWASTLETYAFPVFGNVSVAEVDRALVLKVLKPIWSSRNETARRVRGRIESILDAAAVLGQRSGENPARWRGYLDKVLSARPKNRTAKHHAAVPIDDLPLVYARLRKSDGRAALALRFAILTAARAGEVTGAQWSEIDAQAKIWTVPADRIKASRTHRVPLSREALEVLTKARKVATGDLVFPGRGMNRPLSVTSLTKALRVAGSKATVHGFRSTFRDWASERTNFPHAAAEMALAHAIGDKVEAAYRRGDLFDRRATMMQAWATFAHTLPSAKVIALGGRRRA